MKKFLVICFTIVNLFSLSAQVNTDRVMMIGRNAIYFEDYFLAIQYFNQIIKAKPYLAEPYYYRAIAKFYLEDYQGTNNDCTQSLEKNPFYTDAYQLRANARQNLKDYKGAIADYRFSLKENPNDKYILINLGISNILNKDLDSAGVYLDELIELNPSFTEGFLTRANYFLEKQDTVNAIVDIDTAIEKDKYFAPSYAMKGSIESMQKKYDEALISYDEAIKLDPLATSVYINRGLTKYYKNDLRGAMSDYDHVISIDKSNIIAHFNRALLRSQVGDDNRAIEDFDYVLKYEPDNYIAYMNRALLKDNIGDSRGALMDLNIVLMQYPNFYQGYQLRSDIKRKRNDMAGAESDYNKARSIENKVRREILAGKMPEGLNKNEKNTREISDNSIDKFDQLVVTDQNEESENKFRSKTRGKIQNKQTNTELLPIFIISYYQSGNESQKFIHYTKELQQLNLKSNIFSNKLIITNKEIALDSMQIQIFFNSIAKYSEMINGNSNNSILYFARALDYELIQDYNSSIEDLTKALNLNSDFTLAYFSMAITKTKILKLRISKPELYNIDRVSDANTQQQYKAINSAEQNKGSNITKNNNEKYQATDNALLYKIEYDQIADIYGKILRLNPDFIYAYYNRAEIKAMQSDYRGAILDYNEAIRREPEFAQAYYNRGLCRLKIKDNQRGLEDLRKAGELGIISSYNLIKRLTD